MDRQIAILTIVVALSMSLAIALKTVNITGDNEISQIVIKCQYALTREKAKEFCDGVPKSKILRHNFGKAVSEKLEDIKTGIKQCTPPALARGAWLRAGDDSQEKCFVLQDKDGKLALGNSSCTAKLNSVVCETAKS